MTHQGHRLALSRLLLAVRGLGLERIDLCAPPSARSVIVRPFAGAGCICNGHRCTAHIMASLHLAGSGFARRREGFTGSEVGALCLSRRGPRLCLPRAFPVCTPCRIRNFTPGLPLQFRGQPASVEGCQRDTPPFPVRYAYIPGRPIYIQGRPGTGINSQC